ncbi:MAG: META domain-containing protein [Planctomycetota bacterium]|jgi:heat shock protein HslJ|nr:META domain-containing protein [Planctomycetota bacterium]
MRMLLIIVLSFVAVALAAETAPAPGYTLASLHDAAGVAELPAEPVISCRLDGDRIGGKGPVNNWFGGLVVAGETRSVAKGPIGATMMMGPENLMALEQRFMRALEAIQEQPIVVTDGGMTMRSADGSVTMQWTLAP